MRYRLSLLDSLMEPMEHAKPLDEDDQNRHDRKEPMWGKDYSMNHVGKYIRDRCEKLINDGRYRDLEALQSEFDIDWYL